MITRRNVFADRFARLLKRDGTEMLDVRNGSALFHEWGDITRHQTQLNLFHQFFLKKKYLLTGQIINFGLALRGCPAQFLYSTELEITHKIDPKKMHNPHSSKY